MGYWLVFLPFVHPALPRHKERPVLALCFRCESQAAVVDMQLYILKAWLVRGWALVVDDVFGVLEFKRSSSKYIMKYICVIQADRQ